MPGTTDTVKAILTPGEFVIRKEAVDMIGAPILERINDMPEKGGHSSIDRLIQMATMSNMKAMYGGGMVNAGPKPMQNGGMLEEYGGGGRVYEYMHGGMAKKKMMNYADGGKVKNNLKPVPEDNPGLAKLPEKVRNRMGYMQDGGMVEDNLMGMMGGGMMKKPMSSYQDGGTVSLPQYVDAVKKVTGALGGSFDEDMYTEEGGFSRLNLANRLGVDPESMTIDTLSYEGPGSFVFDVKGMSPEGKELSAQETMSGGGLPVEMVLNRAIEDHANRGKGDSAEAFRLSDQRNSLLNILQGIKDNVRFQEGGMVGPPPPPMDDPLQIGMRQASPEMYAGQTLGGMSAEEALEQGIMQSQMIKNQAIEDSAMQSLQLLRVRAMMADSSMAEPSSESKMEMMMSDPSMQQFLNGVSLDSLINAQMQSGGMQMPTINRDMGEMLNMEMMKRGREALMRGMMREGQKDPLEALR